jgi:hypothetical protein
VTVDEANQVQARLLSVLERIADSLEKLVRVDEQL